MNRQILQVITDNIDTYVILQKGPEMALFYFTLNQTYCIYNIENKEE